jgi:NitT/TauT family transport system substrate-binding protein
MKNIFLQEKILRWIFPVICFSSILLLWQLASLIFKNLLFILPAPSDIYFNLIENWGRFSFHIKVTLKEMFFGLSLAFSIAFPTAWLMAENKTARLTIQPLFVISQSIPMFAIAPIIVLWFGWGFISIVIPTALMVFFPLVLTLYQGLTAVPKEMKEFFILHKATKIQTFFKLSLPFALPYIFSGIKISAAVAAIATVSAEWTGAQAGLGMLIQESRRDTDLVTTFGAILLVVLLSLFLYSSTLLVEKMFKPSKKIKNYAFLLFIIPLFALSSCQNESPKEEKTTLLLDWFPNPNHVALYAGLEKGFFKEENIYLNIQKIYDPSDSIPYLTSKKTDLAIYYMPQAIRAKSKGADIKVVGSLINKPLNCILYRKDRGIKDLLDLENKVIGYAMASLNTLQLKKLCEEKKITPKETICLATDLVSALTMKRVDATLGCYCNIEKEQLSAMGIETGSFPISVLGIPDYEELVVLANEIKGCDKNFVLAFKRALQKSIDFSKANPNEAFNLYIKANPDKMQSTRLWEEKAWQSTVNLYSTSQNFDEQAWQAFSNWMNNNALIIHPVSAKDLNPL